MVISTFGSQKLIVITFKRDKLNYLWHFHDSTVENVIYGIFEIKLEFLHVKRRVKKIQYQQCHDQLVIIFLKVTFPKVS